MTFGVKNTVLQNPKYGGHIIYNPNIWGNKRGMTLTITSGKKNHVEMNSKDTF